MRPCRVTAALLFSIPATVAASEGLLHAAVYECNAVEITKVMVEVCSSLKPDLSKRSAAAYSKWLQRNSVKAEARKKECSAELDAYGNTVENQRQLKKLGEQIKELKQEMIEGFRAKVASQGVVACDEALSQLETGHGGVDLQ